MRHRLQAYWFSGRQSICLFNFHKSFACIVHILRHHLYKLCVICVCDSSQSVQVIIHAAYFSCCILLRMYRDSCSMSVTQYFSLVLFGSCSIALHSLVHYNKFFGKNSHLSWFMNLKVFWIQIESPMAKNNSPQNTTKYFTSGTKHFFYGIHTCVSVHLCECASVCGCAGCLFIYVSAKMRKNNCQIK